jgi:AraC family transcriptional regulator, regulatory protein of adaptative response / methylated-DNA-[protein]-cysteine methyltransferase
MATMLVETLNTYDAEWRAVEDHDAQYDGQFVYAVRTTGIYCRPSCPSRRPVRANVSFFSSPDDAESAGYRACRRCNPKNVDYESRTAKSVERARAFLDANAERVVSLAELATHVGVSASHLQRSFKQIVGVSPKQYQNALRVQQLKNRLRAGDTVSRATYEAGFGSSSRVYEQSDATLGMTPASFRRGGAGIAIRYTIADAPLGRVLVATTTRGVCAVELGATDADVERALRDDFPNALIARGDDEHDSWVKAVIAQIAGSRNESSRSVPLDPKGTAFQLRVWKALRDIPRGERRSYSDVAAAIGQPTAIRAVARACATNKLALLVPCHRVVRSDGALSGYKWGIDRKRRLLDDEAK